MPREPASCTVPPSRSTTSKLLSRGQAASSSTTLLRLSIAPLLGRQVALNATMLAAWSILITVSGPLSSGPQHSRFFASKICFEGDAKADITSGNHLGANQCRVRHQGSSLHANNLLEPGEQPDSITTCAFVPMNANALRPQRKSPWVEPGGSTCPLRW
mmetsp:Transcript_3750/g.13128  ORF Transcript_3750/g.13128 Transcript_3750/m.13128 type:complete len:159 (-) Transcript_3750:2615-3091(-)